VFWYSLTANALSLILVPVNLSASKTKPLGNNLQLTSLYTMQQIIQPTNLSAQPVSYLLPTNFLLLYLPTHTNHTKQWGGTEI